MRSLTCREIALTTILIASMFVFTLNLAVTLYALIKFGPRRNISDVLGPHSGKGNCTKVFSYNKWLHFAINMLSTILVGASNYCAQLLVAPTRKDIDSAHANGKWLDIGVQSTRNLRNLCWKRGISWLCLIASSSVLHLV